MKRVKSLIKLTNRNTESLDEKEQSLVIGGYCICGCFYSECGGSSTELNGLMNSLDDLYSEEPKDQAEWNGASPA